MFWPFDQLHGYAPYEIIVELAVIGLCVYIAFRFLQGTRGAGIIKGFLLVLVILTLGLRVISGTSEAFARLDFLYTQFLGLATILLIVVFQPELRQAMIRIGQTALFRRTASDMNRIADAVSEAVNFLSKGQFGGLMAIERNVGLRGLTEGGVRLDAELSPQLLESIFWPNSPLHDLGVVIREDRVISASVQFPLVEEGTLPAELGSRHRAAVGLTMESDAVVVVVSEENGSASIAKHGRLIRDIPLDEFKSVLLRELDRPRAAAGPRRWADLPRLLRLTNGDSDQASSPAAKETKSAEAN